VPWCASGAYILPLPGLLPGSAVSAVAASHAATGTICRLGGGRLLKPASVVSPHGRPAFHSCQCQTHGHIGGNVSIKSRTGNYLLCNFLARIGQEVFFAWAGKVGVGCTACYESDEVTHHSRSVPRLLPGRANCHSLSALRQISRRLPVPRLVPIPLPRAIRSAEPSGFMHPWETSAGNHARRQIDSKRANRCSRSPHYRAALNSRTLTLNAMVAALPCIR